MLTSAAGLKLQGAICVLADVHVHVLGSRSSPECPAVAQWQSPFRGLAS